MLTCGKLENVKAEMKRMRLSEVRWLQERDFFSGDYRVVNTATVEESSGHAGVAIIIVKKS